MNTTSQFSWWRRIPIHSKLQIGVAGFALLVLLIGSIFLSWVTKSYFHEKIQRDLSMLAQVLADNSRAAMLFNDEISASKILAALQGNPSIEAAAIIGPTGIFSTYPSDANTQVFNAVKREKGTYLLNGHYYAVASIEVTEKKLGHLVLYSNLDEWQFVEKQLEKLFLGLFISLLILTLVIYGALRAYITKPLSNLSDWATAVSKHKNFNALAKKDSDDEIGQLVDSLNTMLVELAKQASIVSLNERLQKEIEERTKVERDLIEMRNRAESANEAKSRFLANMSHEIRTPMNAIMGFIEIVLESNLSDEQLKHLITVKRSAKLLHGLLNDILDVSKLEEGKLQLEAIPFSIQQVVNDALKTFEMKAREKQLQFSATIAPAVPKNFIGDPLRLSQVLINLVGNAIKFTEEGGVFLEVDRQDSETLLFKIIDSGIGIPSDKLEHIFQNFAQADTSVSRKYGGSGLGTTISKQLVELMGGRIWVESEEGVGSTFYFTAKLIATDRAVISSENKHITKHVLLPEKPLRVLVAEDVEENAELLRVRLGALGHHIDVAQNGNEAIALFQRNAYDIILMDVQMPEKDGLTATKEIRALDEGKHIPILALTASVLKENRLACEEAGMNGFVSKPIVFFDLFTEMARVLQIRRSCIEVDALKVSFMLNGYPGIDSEKAAALWQDKASYIRNLKLFMQTHRDAAHSIDDAILANDLPRARKILHALKGAAGNLALIKIYEVVVGLSDALRQGAIPLAKSFTQELSAAVEEAAASVKAINAAHTTAPTYSDTAAPLNFASFDQLIQDIDTAFSKGETADDNFQTALRIFQTRGVPDDTIEPLLSALDEFEFAKASTLLKGMAIQLKKTGTDPL